MPTPVQSNPNNNLPAGSILPGVGVANGSGGFTSIAPGASGYSIPPPPPARSTSNSTNVTTAPATSSAPSSAIPASLSAAPGSATVQTNPDSGYSQAEENITPGAPESEEDFWSALQNEFAPVISSINSAETSAETAAYAAGTSEMTDLNESLGDRGLSGSSTAASQVASANRDTAGAIATAKQNQATALSSAYQYLTGQAHTEFTDALTQNTTLSQNYVASMKANAQATVNGIAESGITSGSELQTKSPKAYAALLQYYNGDPDALNSALVMAQPANKIVQSWSQNGTYYQLVTDPITGQPKIQSVQTNVQVPTSWVANKVSTSTLMMQDPNNPGNAIIYTTDPLSGQVTVSGTGTGSAYAAQYNSSQSGSTTTPPTSTPPTTPATGAGTASTTVASILGISDPTQPLSDVISTAGIGPLVSAIIQSEGSQLPTSLNNPGDVKYVPGMANATDSGVTASDGGTFAKFNTAQDGQDAIASTIQNAASGTDQNYGATPTLQSFMDTYSHTGNNAPTAPTVSATINPTTGLSTTEYGALAGVAGFNPSSPGLDQDAFNYLKSYLSGQTQSSSSGMGGASLYAAKQGVQARAQDLYYQATGHDLPNQSELTANLGYITGNQALLNSLQVQEGTIKANSDLLQSKITAGNINQNAPAINAVIDPIIEALGNTPVAAYNAQVSTLSNELGSLLALKNASGTTVHDKLISAGLLPETASAEQEAQVVNTIMQEAQNAHSAITVANAKLYQNTDPLGIDPQNPLNDPSSFASSVGINLPAIQTQYPNMTPQEIVSDYVSNH